MWNKRTLKFSVLLGLAFTVDGCGWTENNRFAVHPVSGSVSVDGMMESGVRLAFHPQDEELISSHIFPRATTNASGSFRLSTYAVDDGVPAGEYLVTASWCPTDSSDPEDTHPDDGPAAKERLAEEFTDPETTPLRVKIHAGSNQIGPLEIRLRRAEKKKGK